MPSTNLSDSQAKDLIEKRLDLHGEKVERRPFLRQMLKSRAMYFGKQHLLQDRNGRLYDPKKLSPLTVLYKANLMLGDMVRAMLTVTGARGEFVVPPIDGSKTQRHAAWVSTKLFEHISRVNRLDERDRLATAFAAIDGTAVWKVSWDPKRGEPRRFYWAGSTPSQGVLLDPDEATRMEKEEKGEFDDLWTGDVRIGVSSLFSHQWDWDARENGFEDASWASQHSMLTLDQLEEYYGPKARQCRPDDPAEGSMYYNEAISFMSSAYGGLTAQLTRENYKEGERCQLAIYWERANAKNNWMGREVHYAGGVVLENRDNTNRKTKNEIPLEAQHWVTAPGRFIGISLAEQLANPQIQYNASHANIQEHNRVFGHPAIFLPDDWGVPAGQYSVQPGMVYHKKKNAMGKIDFGPVPPAPEAALQSLEISRNEMAQISSQQTIDPGQLRSGPGLELLIDEHNKLMIEPAENFLKAKGRVGAQALEFAQRYYPEEQVIQYVGADRKFRVLSFKRVDVHANMHVLVDRTKILSSPALVRARIGELMQSGAIDPTNPDHLEAILKAFEFETADELITDRLQEEENQEQEIDEIVENPSKWIEERMDMMAPMAESPEEEAVVQGYPVNPWDDHRVHARVMVRYLRSLEFRSLDPVAKSLLIRHWQDHQAEVDKELQRQLAMEEALRGGAGEKGQPSRPKAPAA